ncbi:MAG: hypothetical protein OXU20_14520 [Myxococcales bacterium]|nr:hypothetical protein [Myxococcales bacterium]MDD9970074.1 hypothetical protein [Myxococcales bacterium]
MGFEPTIQLGAVWSAVNQGFVVHLFEGHLSLADMDVMEAQSLRWLEANPGERVELSVIYSTKARMDTVERARMTELIKHGERGRVASATVILAEGLTGAMQRSVLTGMLLIVPPVHPQRVFGALRPALEWLLPHVRRVNGEAVTLAGLCAACDDLRRAFDARPRA